MVTLKKLPNHKPDEKNNFTNEDSVRSFEKKEFDFGDALNYRIFCKGINGTQINIEVFFDGVSKKKYSGKIEKGKFEKEDSINF